MREKNFLNHRFSFVLEAVLGLLQSFISPIGICWFFLFLRRIENNPSFKAKSKIAWWSSFVYYTGNLYWISFALTVEIEKFWWLIPVGIFAMPAYIALFSAFSTLWSTQRGSKFSYLFPLSWICLEWVRGWIFTGFPWAFLGHTWIDTNIIQFISWFGVFPLSLLVFYCYNLLFHQRKLVYKFFLFVSIVSIMYYPISFTENSFFAEKVRLVQPNINQANKWENYNGNERFQLLLNLSRTNNPEVRAIILPETALTFFLDVFPDRLSKISAIVPKNGYILTGAPRKEWLNLHTMEDYHMRTSLLAINPQGRIVDYYDKTHLIPFGEYLPEILRYFFPNLSKITHGEKDYTPGIGPKILSLPGLPSFNPIICYESIFPEEIVTNDRADFILLVTNDAWFGNSVGPKQHLNLARIRAIEQGLSVVRSANTGISGVIDPKGNLLESLPLGQRGFIDIAIPKPLPQTFYSKHLYLEKYIMAVLSFMLMLELAMRLRNRHRIKNDR